MQEFKEKARTFLEKDTQFHLGNLPSEQSNPKTKGLDAVFKRSIHDGVKCILGVDRDLIPVFERVFASTEYSRLVECIAAAIKGSRRVVISSCGASGRVSIMLEACWRKFWQRFKVEHYQLYTRCVDHENQVCSIMTGGDYALVRSVENFEDYPEFGRQQTRELNVGPGDCLIALNEAGETASVYGSVDQALESGAKVFLVFNNPPDILCRYLERARKAIENPQVASIALYGGPMAIAGSTRMQATTSEFFVIGTALEEALFQILSTHLNAEELSAAGIKSGKNRVAEFIQLLDDLESDKSVDGIADFIEFEEKIYKNGGLVTYYADDFLLDIFTDTTERFPTFMLPPFRKYDDRISDPSWAFVKNPLYPTHETWKRVYGREPHCLDWDTALYYKIGAPPQIADTPPLIYQRELYKFLVGNEADESRLQSPAAAIAINSPEETCGKTFSEAFAKAAGKYDIIKKVIVGKGTESAADIVIPLKMPDSPLTIMRRLAIKLVLNTLSSGTMVRLGRVKSNLMWCVGISNKKLIDRSIRLISEIAGVDYEQACYALFETMEEFENTDFSGHLSPSPAQYTIQRLMRSGGN